MTVHELKSWAWDWAQRLNDNISLTQIWLEEIKQLSTPITQAQGYETALVFATTAYFEYIKCRWSQERAQSQIDAVIHLLGGANA